MTLVAGLDGFKRGWVAVTLRDGRFEDALTFSSFGHATEALAEAAAIGIDIPIGLPSGSTRQADALARRFVGPRASSVFNTPPREVMEAASYDEARAIAVDRYGKGVSSQTYRGLRAKVLEVDAAVGPGSNVFEVHPEVSFRGLAGRHLAFTKKSWNGQAERRRLVCGAGIDLPETLDGAGGVPVDDVLDAAVVAWSAARLAAGVAVPIPDPPEVDELGRQVAIWW